MDFLASNIRQLRIEARLSQEELAEQMGVATAIIIEWEKGTRRPNHVELMKLCPIIRIHEEDILERDIVSEREVAGKEMKKLKHRNTYGWYYGNPKKILLYVAYLLAVPVIYGVAYLYWDVQIEAILKAAEEFGGDFWVNWLGSGAVYIYAYSTCASIAGIYISIMALIRYRYRFVWWHIFWLGFMFGVAMFLGNILMIPYCFYCLYQVIVKRGRNH